MLTQNPYLYEFNTKNPYTKPLIPVDKFETIHTKIQQHAVAYLCSIEPSNSTLYQSLAEEFKEELNYESYKESEREFFAGCFDLESNMFKSMFTFCVVQMACYLRFLKERKMYKKELDQIEIKNPMYIISMPRSGSTFTHFCLVSDPHASSIQMYEHFCPGSKTMSEEGRLKIATAVVNSINNSNDQFKSIHALNPHNPEEEYFFQTVQNECFVHIGGLPRLEQYRCNAFTRNFDYVYEGIIDEMKMHLMEFPLKDKDFICMKCATHFITLIPFFKIMAKDEYNPRIVWIHRDPVKQLYSAITAYLNAMGRLKDDLGINDYEFINNNVIYLHQLYLKNALTVRESWIKENPERKKFICDISFKEMIQNPIETTKKIYEYFGIEYSKEFDEALKDTLENGQPQKEFGRKEAETSKITFNPEEIRKSYDWYFNSEYGKYL
ncbi:sulfotransferase, putative [Entamoeba histolytica HM-3:IMSS]|uniref:Sulfotransferase, putative n=2 Tax=Entamoeba histolytica TaxID=5759 RepID=M2QJL3_ENTHI|nr:sulfotransferase, putative [Entamoeba histolytica KU27]EMS17831.1 sulfotransferase, putative [Entamoeba histolytica HM-3:IMSS]